MDNNELIKFLAWVHDALQEARKTHNDLAEAAVQAVSAALDAVLGNPGDPIRPTAEYMFILRTFAQACPESPYATEDAEAV